ncbi:hypothetical protein BDY19DRAFT_955176 [Irpex rosettiformis]|uniref:Uncharacterized protein n=1 Tax=Irpex rosettiformis TaxID=378272 RepID=A0ACB8TZF0_9APHY|nr:hypothetical protein BDY19DRAFT_955176 [Irpex rosettiformis]
MLQRATAQLIRLPTSRRRCISSFASASHYHPKVRALPFALSSEEAFANLEAPKMLGFTLKVDNFYRNWNSLSPRIDWNGPLKFIPKEITPMYLPSWFVDSEFTISSKFLAQMAYSQSTSMRRVSKRGLVTHAVPFSRAMRRQHGAKIVCLPYTSSPLSLYGAMRDTLKGGEITRHVVAAYPVLIPIYLARYSYDLLPGPVEAFVVVEAASKEGGTVYMQNITGRVLDFQGDTGGKIADLGIKIARKAPEFEVRPPDGKNFFEPLDDATAREKLLYLRLNPAMSSLKDSPFLNYARYEQNVRSGAQIDFQDLRVREWTEKEVEDMRVHMFAIRSGFRDLSSKKWWQQAATPADMALVSDAIEATKPKWLVEWESNQ